MTPRTMHTRQPTTLWSTERSAVHDLNLEVHKSIYSALATAIRRGDKDLAPSAYQHTTYHHKYHHRYQHTKQASRTTLETYKFPHFNGLPKECRKLSSTRLESCPFHPACNQHWSSAALLLHTCIGSVPLSQLAPSLLLWSVS